MKLKNISFNTEWNFIKKQMIIDIEFMSENRKRKIFTRIERCMVSSKRIFSEFSLIV